MNQLSDTGHPQEPSFADRTGRSRLLLVTSWISLLGALGILIFGVPMIAWGRFDLAPVVLIFCAMNFVGLIGKWLAVRCPHCRAFVVWHLYKTVGITSFRERLKSEACPKCGYVPPIDESA